jgi:glucose/arabinose dehydrogenase
MHLHCRTLFVESRQEGWLRELNGSRRERQGRRARAFATGWLQGESAWGRPADALVMPDESLLVSDDYAGAIYRISYRGA